MQFTAIHLFNLTNSSYVAISYSYSFKIKLLLALLKEWPNSTWQWQFQMVLAPPSGGIAQKGSSPITLCNFPVHYPIACRLKTKKIGIESCLAQVC